MDDVGHQSTHTGQVVIGVDTHKDEHVAVPLTGRVSVSRASLAGDYLRVSGARKVVPQPGRDPRIWDRGHRILRRWGSPLPDRSRVHRR